MALTLAMLVPPNLDFRGARAAIPHTYTVEPSNTSQGAGLEESGRPQPPDLVMTSTEHGARPDLHSNSCHGPYCGACFILLFFTGMWFFLWWFEVSRKTPMLRVCARHVVGEPLTLPSDFLLSSVLSATSHFLLSRSRSLARRRPLACPNHAKVKSAGTAPWTH